LKKIGYSDFLFIQKDDWEENFREYGLVLGGFEIEIKLEEAEKVSGERIKLYTKTRY